MIRNRVFLSSVVGIGWLFIFSLPMWSGTVRTPPEPADEEILRIFYPDGKLTKDKQSRYVIHGGQYAEDNVLGEGRAPKIINRIDRLRGRLYQKDREELVVLVDATNENAAACCGGEVVLAVFDLREEKAKPVWIHRLRHMRLVNTDVSLVEANTYGTQQILFKYETWGGVVQKTAIIYMPRPRPDWSQPMAWTESKDMYWIEKDTPDQPFVKIWVGNLKWNEGPYFYDQDSPQPRGSGFPRAAYTSNIRFTEIPFPGWVGWKSLIEERTITMLLGKDLDPPLKVKVTYHYGGVYFLAGRN